jgi:hypothetical protein
MFMMFLLLDSANPFVGGYLSRDTKSSNNIFLKEFHHDFFRCFLGWDSFHPPGEVISGSQNPSVSVTRIVFEFTDEIQSPLLKGCFYNDGFKGKGGEALLASKKLTWLTSSNISMCVGEDSRPIVPCS